jgi:hypothetical protein
LLPRLPLYPSYALDLSRVWLDIKGGRSSVAAAVLRHCDSSGLVRGSDWCAGKVGVEEEGFIELDQATIGSNKELQQEWGNQEQGKEAEGKQEQGKQEVRLGRGGAVLNEVRISDHGSSSNSEGSSSSSSSSVGSSSSKGSRGDQEVRQVHGGMLMQDQLQQNVENTAHQHYEEHHRDEQEEQQQQPRLKPATPPLRVKPSRAWRIELDRWGMLAGVAAPTTVNRELQELLDAALAVTPGQTRSNMGVDHGQSQSDLGGGKRVCEGEERGKEEEWRWDVGRWERKQQQHQQQKEEQSGDVGLARLSSSSSSSLSKAAAAAEGLDWQQEQVELLLSARGADMKAVCEAADELRRRVCGDEVTYVVNRNINYTNVCTYGCTFCAFSKVRSGLQGTMPYCEMSRVKLRLGLILLALVVSLNMWPLLIVSEVF